MMEPKRQRTKLWWAVLASIFLHLVVAYSLVAFNTAFAPAPAIEDDTPVQLTMVDSSLAPTPTPINPPYLETDPSRESEEQPKEKTFESNANSIAASKVEASGEAPLPSQDGKERPFIDLQTQQFSLPSEGAKPQPPAQPAASVSTPTPTPAPAEKPTPQPTPKATATPLPEPLATPAPEQLAMLTGTPPPPIRDPQETEATPPPEVARTVPMVTPRPLPERPASSYQRQKEETKISGQITNRGASAANAVATPLGKYKKQIQDAIGSRWYYYVMAKSDLASLGTARLTAEVDAQGHVQNLRIISNSSNEAFANICLQSFQEAQIPPIPPDLASALPGGRMPLEFSFTYFAN
jgi:outer membrane biosynthesis protein TonB